MLRLPKFRYHNPNTLEEAVSLLGRFSGKAKIVAGGTDLFPSLKRREVSLQHVISIRGIEDLKRIECRGNKRLIIGPTVSHEELGMTNALPKPEAFEGLKKACGTLASPQIRVMGTIGGNICNASPSADSLPSLLALEATVELTGPDGSRVMHIEEFLRGPFKTHLGRAEILTGIQIPIPEGVCAGSYVKLPKVTEKDETLVGIAVFLEIDQLAGTFKRVRIGMGSVGPTPMRARMTEAALEGKGVTKALLAEAGSIALTEANPRSRADYRREMVGYLLPIALDTALDKMGIKL